MVIEKDLVLNRHFYLVVQLCNCSSVLTGLSKAFDTINNIILIAKLNASGFSKDSLKLIKVTEVIVGKELNSSFSSWSELALEVPHGSALGPILYLDLNIFVNDLFY